MMKKILFLLFAISFTAFTSCSKDNDENNSDKGNENTFVWAGDWTDPEDPNYSPNYMPILRDWINVEGGYKFYRFKALGGIDRYVYNNSTKEWERDLVILDPEINSTAFRYKTGYNTVTMEYKFIYESGTKYLMLRTQFPTGQWEKFKQRLS